MVALGGGAVFVVDGGVYLVPYGDGLEGEDFVGEDALDGLGCASDFGYGSVVVGGVEDADITLLAAGVGVEGGGVEDDFALFFGEEGLDADAVFDQGEDAGAVEAGTARAVSATGRTRARTRAPSARRAE